MKNNRLLNHVSMIGALPPLKGNAYYSMRLAIEMAQRITVDFVAFKKLYPEFLYPGGVSDNDPKFFVRKTDSLSIRKIITYYNPWTWLRAGFAAQAEVVHLQWWSVPLAPIYFVILLVLKLRKKRIIFTVHNVLPHETSIVDRIATRMVLAFADASIVHSESNKESLIAHFGLPSEIIHKVHMPVHDMYGGCDLTRADARLQIDLPRDARVVLSFGNLREYKGLDCLIRALPKIEDVVPSIHLLIVGQPWNNWPEYERLIEMLELTNKITTVLEYVPMSAVSQYFVASDMVVLPYRWFEAQSGVGSIGLAYSLPIVVTRVGGLPELVKDKRAVVEPNNPTLLANAISNIFRDDFLLDKLRQDSSDLKDQYSWREAVKSTLNIYENIV